jgi:TRAP transporter TAXI family solute receptor
VSDRVRVCLLALTVFASACSHAAPEPPRVRVRLATGTPGGNFYALGEALAREYRRALPSVDIDVRPSDGSASNLDAIERGDADIGLSHADVTYLAFAGRLNDHRAGFTRLRGIAMLQIAAVHVVVRANSGIRTVAQLRGRRISLGRPSWGTSSTAALVLNAFGLGLGDARVEPLRYDEAASRLASGELDALLVTGTYPLAAVTAAASAGARILPLDGEAIDRLRRDYPFFSRAAIPAGTYPGQPNAIHTIGVHTLLVCRADLDEALVHDLTERLFAILPLLPTPEAPLGRMDLAHAAATPIPLHEGAARYYRERELIR